MFKVLVEGCEPTLGSKYSACVDLYASETVVIGAGETKLIGLGVCIDEQKLIDACIEDNDGYARGYSTEHFKNSHYLQLMLRSSLGKDGLMMANGVGIIDLDYKDEIKMLICNPFQSHYIPTPSLGVSFVKDIMVERTIEIKKGDKIAQIMLC